MMFLRPGILIAIYNCQIYKESEDVYHSKTMGVTTVCGITRVMGSINVVMPWEWEESKNK